jgi:hypothetical protein
MPAKLHAPMMGLTIALVGCGPSTGGGVPSEAGGPDASIQEAATGGDAGGSDSGDAFAVGINTWPVDASACTTGDPLGTMVNCTEPVDGGATGWPDTWAMALAMACPPSATTSVSRCTGGLNLMQLSGLDTQTYGYYSAATGNLVAVVAFGGGGVPPFCEGPNPPPCISCVNDDSLCPGVTDGGGNDSSSALDSGTTDAG